MGVSRRKRVCLEGLYEEGRYFLDVEGIHKKDVIKSASKGRLKNPRSNLKNKRQSETNQKNKRRNKRNST